MRIKGALLLLAGLVLGLLSYAVKGRLDETLTDDCEILDEHLVIRKGIIRKNTYKVKYENITTIRFNIGFSDRLLGKERLTIVTTQPNNENISMITNYGTAEDIRTRVEEEWDEE